MREEKGHDELVEEPIWLHDDEDDGKIINNRGDDDDNKTVDSSSSGEDSMVSDDECSIITSSSDATDHGFSPLNSREDLFDLSEMMCQLPIKRGLSKFYDGKSASFTSFSKVKCVEDLKKKTIPYGRISKSYGNGLSYCSYKTYTRPKAVISKKKTPRCASLLSSLSSKKQSCMSTKPPMS